MAQEDDVSTVEAVGSSFRRLQDSAANLNKVAEGLAQAISDVEHLLKRLNLGVEAWVEINRQESSNGKFWAHEVGYARIGPRWCLAVREVEGHEAAEPDDWYTREYPFNESPRRLRVDAVKKLPSLLNELAANADGTAKDLTKEVADAQQFVTALRGRPQTAGPRTVTDLQLEALRGRAAQPSPPPMSAKEADKRAGKRLKELAEQDRKAEHHGHADAPEK